MGGKGKRKVQKYNPFDDDDPQRSKEAKIELKRQKTRDLHNDKSFRSLCRSPLEYDKPLYMHKDTVECFVSGCIACAYKLIVSPPANNDSIKYAANIRPEECLRHKF